MSGQRVIFCLCRHMKLVSPELVERVLGALAARNANVEVVDDLCELAAAKDPRLWRWTAEGPLRIFACYERAVRWLLSAGGAAVAPESLDVVNLRRPEESDWLTGLPAGKNVSVPVSASAQEARGNAWIPWFPVIDGARCMNCGQCVSFCLFGVYEKTNTGEVRVFRPRKCKTFCPACARVCPQAAIIFPKHDKSPINGDQPTPENLREEKMQTGLKDLLQGDVYETLRRRQQAGVPAEGAVSPASLEAAIQNRQGLSSTPAPAAPGTDKKTSSKVDP